MIRLVKFNREPAYTSLFNRFFEGEFNQQSFVPMANVQENENGFDLKLVVPGYTKEQVKISLDENILTVSAEIENKQEEQEYTQEFSFGSFSRSFRLPKNIEVDAIKANQENGILSIQIPKRKEEPKLTKLIEIA